MPSASNLVVTLTKLAAGSSGENPIEEGSDCTTEGVLISDSSVQASDAMLPDSPNSVLRVYAPVACWVAIGANPTAVTGGSGCRYIEAGGMDYFAVQGNQKLAVVQDGTW